MKGYIKMRINKLLSNFGICSRKETCRLIEDKRIIVNGKLCVQGQWVEESDEILLDGEVLRPVKKVYLAFNKPKGIMCTLEKNVQNNIGKYLNYHQYVFPVGRLDKDSEGLIILTNDGEFSNKILECENYHEREYIVRVDRPFDEEFLKSMRNGVEIYVKGGSGIKRISDTEGLKKINEKEEKIMLNSICTKRRKSIIKTRPCDVERIDEDTFKIVLTQGLNRQIRKMSSALGYNVVFLKRVRIMNICLGDLKIGNYEEIPENKIKEIMK